MKNTKKSKGDARVAGSSIAASRSKNSLSNSQLKPACLALGTLVATASISGAFLASNRVSADNDTVVDVFSIEVPVSCSMSGNVTKAHSATLANGTYSGGTTEYANGIGSTTLSVSCNDAGGFSIYTVGFTGNKEGDNTLKGTNTGLTIPTGVYSQGDTTSKWSMKITKGADSGDTTNHPLTIDNNFNNYHTVPSKSDGYQRIAHKDAATDMSATPGASVTTTYDAYIDTTQATDAYTGQVKYVMVHPFSSTDDNKPEIAATYMQDVDQIKAELANAAVGTELEVADSRDNKTYTVAKMADGNIWMNQNLDFDIDSTKTYTSADTDIKADWKPSTSTTTGTSWGTSSSYYNLPQSYDPGDLCWKGTPSTSSGALSNQTQPCSTAGSNKHYHVGNYYDWTAAVAMNDSSSYTSQNTDVDQSICPAGWMLPKSGITQTGSGSFQYLVNQQSLTSGTSGNIHTSPVYFVYGGLWNGSSSNVSNFGYYWSSVVYSSGYAYNMHFYAAGTLYPQGDGNRRHGRSVRCVARPSA